MDTDEIEKDITAFFNTIIKRICIPMVLVFLSPIIFLGRIIRRFNSD